MSDPVLASYEAVAYMSKAVPLAEQDAMAAMATLHGLTPPPADRCRVLELGCGTGGNLHALASRFRKSTFVGVDLSPGQIDRAAYAASELGLQNVVFHAKSIADVDDSYGLFDYIICHGVYSWVPAAIRDEIFRVCSRNLAPNGIAYVSYNTYPGWHRRGMLRDMLAFHDDPSLPPDRRLTRAREFAAALAAADPTDDTPHGIVLRHEVREMEQQADRHLFHDQLAPVNEPVYFADFAKQAASHALKYVSEARLPVDTGATVKIREALGPSVDVIRLEQYLDFVRGREFRRSLLCHDDLEPSPMPQSSAIPKLLARTSAVRAQPSPEDAARGPSVGAFKTPRGVTLTTNNQPLIATLGALADAAPAVVAFDDLLSAVNDRLTSAEETIDRDSLSETLMQCAGNGLVEFRTLASGFVVRAGDRPKATALARWQAPYFDSLTSFAHTPVKVTPVERYLLPHLDGANDRGRLVKLLEHGFTSGELQVGSGRPSRDQVTGVVDDVLERLGRAGLLLA